MRKFILFLFALQLIGVSTAPTTTAEKTIDDVPEDAADPMENISKDVESDVEDATENIAEFEITNDNTDDEEEAAEENDDNREDDMAEKVPAYKRTILNNYRETFSFQCPTGTSFGTIDSIHKNGEEDRIWAIYCTKNLYNIGSSTWTGDVNEFDREMDFQCAGGHVVTGMGGHFSGWSKDRRYRFQCTQIKNTHATDCHLTGKTVIDKKFEINIPAGYFMTGMKSVHHNRQEDRIFQIEYCKMTSTSYYGGNH